MIYLDNGATTYPKPFGVISGAAQAMRRYSFNSGRGGYAESMNASRQIFHVREQLSVMFGYEPQNIVFTKNCTEALNIAIKGSVNPGDHVLISSLEHNSVYRVVHRLSQQGIVEYDLFLYDPDPMKILKDIRLKMKRHTKVLVCMQASNVFGVSFPLQKIGKLCRQRNIRLIADAAQGAGIMPINGKRDGIDILCAPGHKSLLGPMGTGLMAVREGVNLHSFMEGGTGSASFDAVQPVFLPDRFESGTLNNPGILALGKGLDYINRHGMYQLYHRELQLTQFLYEALFDMKKVILYTPYPQPGATAPILSFNLYSYSSEKTAALLADKHICVRAGYHCAPLAHRHFQTTDNGTVRISVGCFTTKHDCNKFINVVKKL